MIIVTGERGEGKTEALINWALQGAPRDEEPFHWSRFIVVMNSGMVRYLMPRLRRAADRFEANGQPVPMFPDRLVISKRSIHTLRGVDVRNYEYAVDEAGELIKDAFSSTALINPPAVISIGGTAVSARAGRV